MCYDCVKNIQHMKKELCLMVCVCVLNSSVQLICCLHASAAAHQDRLCTTEGIT